MAKKLPRINSIVYGRTTEPQSEFAFVFSDNIEDWIHSPKLSLRHKKRSNGRNSKGTED